MCDPRIGEVSTPPSAVPQPLVVRSLRSIRLRAPLVLSLVRGVENQPLQFSQSVKIMLAAYNSTNVLRSGAGRHVQSGSKSRHCGNAIARCKHTGMAHTAEIQSS